MSWAIWITGPPGSGKSALARSAAERLRALGEPVRVLELDEIRRVLTPAATYSAEEREAVYRALGWMAALLAGVGVPVIVDATAHRRAWRDLARAAIRHFAEVQLVCPLEVCRRREQARTGGHAPRGIYARAGRPGATVPGVDVPYEPALRPELTIDTASEPLAEGAAKIVALVRRLSQAAGPGRPEAPGGWVIWITGRPGSGKSTLARRVAEAVTAGGERAVLLDEVSARRALLDGRPAPGAAEETVHRALACAARLLAEAGVGVVVDALARRRAWRELARELVPCFAEVELVAAPEVCAEREQAARWGLGPEPAVGACPVAAATAPETAPDYEAPRRPELTLRTDLVSVWTAAEHVLLLIGRLRRMARTTVEPRKEPSP